MPQDLLRQCIRVEVGERLSLEAILGHPWLLPNVNSSLDPTKIGPPSSGLGGLPIPSREHGAKGISHPQVKRVTGACIHPTLYSSRFFKLVELQSLTTELCSLWTAWAALPPSPHPRRSPSTGQTRSGWLPREAVGLLESRSRPGLRLCPRPPRPRPLQG